MRKKKYKEKKAIITGITGQDGSYLAEFLIDKGYEVHGIKRRSSSLNTQRIDHLYEEPFKKNRKLVLHYGDLTDSSSLNKIVSTVMPDEIYNLGAQSHVSVSFENPVYTSETNAIGSLKLLEAIRFSGIEKTCKYYQASSSELYGLVRESPQNEKTPFYPRSPYAVSKLYAYWITINYREAYEIFACNGILFNHESERRGETFVTRKITKGLANISQGLESCIHLGNLDSLRDWGHAKDYVEMQWLMLQQKKPLDFVISTGRQYSIREFFKMSANELGINIKWIGKGLSEKAVVISLANKKIKHVKKGQIIVKVSKKYFRPSEVDSLIGDATKARRKLKWKPKVTIKQLIKSMIKKDLAEAIRTRHLLDSGL